MKIIIKSYRIGMYRKEVSVFVVLSLLFNGAVFELAGADHLTPPAIAEQSGLEKQMGEFLQEGSESLKRTVLGDWHVRSGAHMDAYPQDVTSGWYMPYYYTSPGEEVLYTRKYASIFDESHMGLIDIKGTRASSFVDRISSPNVERNGKKRKFVIGDVQYRFLLNEKGNAIDDISVVRISRNHFRFVVNAANTEKVKKWVKKHASEFKCSVTDMREAPEKEEQRIILALQGTVGAQKILQEMTDFDLAKIDYFKSAFVNLTVNNKKMKCLIQRTGYTGEDGFEIHIHPDEALFFWEKVIEEGAKPAGLTARNILRLEAGLPLFGNEWEQRVGAPMPFEYKYGFIFDFKSDFIGRDAALRKKEKSKKALVGIRVLTLGGMISDGDKVFNEKGKEVGYVTSGCRSPGLNATIGLVYIDKKSADVGTGLRVGRTTLVKVVETPFISHIVSDRVKNKKETAKYYLPGGDKERRKKLAVIKEKFGIDSIDGLFAHLKEYFYKGKLNLPEPLSRREVYRELYGLSLKNITGLPCFLGAGYYNEPGSDVVSYLLKQPGFLKSYTPYQWEVSQGNLRLMFLYQSLMAKFLEMDVVNDSVYDGATALAEGVRMAADYKDNRRIIVAGSINPHHKDVLDTYAKQRYIDITYIPSKDTGRIDFEKLKEVVNKSRIGIASIVVQQPNFLGELETEIDKVAAIAQNCRALLHIHSNDPMVFVKTKAPGKYGRQGADIVTAEGQAFVGRPYFGGNNLGIIACKRKLTNNLINYIPGRLVGQSTDEDGNIAFGLALSGREQHVRRKEARSNICTNAALNAVASGVNMLDKGNKGLSEITENSNNKTKKFIDGIHKIPGFKVFSTGPVFREVVVESPVPADKLQRNLFKYGIDAGYDISKHFPHLGKKLVMFSFTGVHTSNDVSNLLQALESIALTLDCQKEDEGEIQTLSDIPESLKRDTPFDIPEISEPVLRKKIYELGKLNFNPEDNPYYLGSVTMMHNPLVNELIAKLEGFSSLHPYTLPEMCQGTLQILYELGEYLKEITGMDDISLNPAAGAHGEIAGLMMMFRYFESQRNMVLIPDSAHGTNPATSAMAKADVRVIKTDTGTGYIDKQDLLNKFAIYWGEIAAIMLTEPNTLGLFENLNETAELLHGEGGQVYIDGANLNALMGRIKLGDFADVVHLNLHKTFSSPHGGGGPGAGPVCVKKHLAPFLPNPRIVKVGNTYRIDYSNKKGIRIGTFLGNIPVLIRAYAYIRTLGEEGLRAASSDAVLNANYLLAQLMDEFEIPYANKPSMKPRMHEFVLSIEKITEGTGVTVDDFAKALQDYDIHPPTVHFPLIVPEAMMIEPTQSASLQELDKFWKSMLAIKKMAYTKPEYLKSAPHATPVRRINKAPLAREDTVILKSENIAGILGIGEEELSKEPTAGIPTAELTFRIPVPGWKIEPDKCLVSANGLWIRPVKDGKSVVVGLTEQLINDHTVEEDEVIKIVDLSKKGKKVKKGDLVGQFQTEKAAFDIDSPFSGTVSDVNEEIIESSRINDDLYGDGWLVVIELDDPEQLDAFERLQKIAQAKTTPEKTPDVHDILSMQSP